MATAIPVVLIGENNEIIKIFDSIKAAYNNSNEKRYSEFINSLYQINYYKDGKYKYYFLHKYNELFNKNIELLQNERAIVRLDKYGKFIDEYENMKEIKEANFNPRMVENVCEGKQRQTYGCIFKWRDEYFQEKNIKKSSELKQEDISNVIEIISKPKPREYSSISVVQLDNNGKIIFIYEKMIHVTLHGYSETSVCKCCKTVIDTCGSRKFMYLKEYLKIKNYFDINDIKNEDFSKIKNPYNPILNKQIINNLINWETFRDTFKEYLKKDGSK